MQQALAKTRGGFLSRLFGRKAEEPVTPEFREVLVAELARSDTALRSSERRPRVVLVVGVNGSGKTTTAAKLAKRLKDGGERPLLAAADTFRAAAIEQLETWASRID